MDRADLARRWDEALARGAASAVSDDADAVAFLQEEELSLPTWKRRMLVRQRMTEARDRAESGARAARVREVEAAKRAGDRRYEVAGAPSVADAAARASTLRRTAEGPSGRWERQLTDTSARNIRRMTTRMLYEMDEVTRGTLAQPVRDQTLLSGQIAAACASTSGAWLRAITRTLRSELGDPEGADRFESSWLPHAGGRPGTLSLMVSAINDALCGPVGLTDATLADAVHRAVEVLIARLQSLVPVCKVRGIPQGMYRLVTETVAHDVARSIIKAISK